MEPKAFLRWGHTDAREVGFELRIGGVSERVWSWERRERRAYQFSHEASRGEVALQEDDEVAAREENAAAEDGDGRYGSCGLIECVETRGWKYESADVREIGKHIYG